MGTTQPPLSVPAGIFALTQAGLDARYAPVAGSPNYASTTQRFTPKAYHLDAANAFFGGGTWQAGQSTVATSLTADTAQGSAVLPVADATGIVAGQQLVVGQGTPNQAIYNVQSVAGNNVTIVGTTRFGLLNGAAVTPLWTNSSHLTTAGWTAYAYFIANAKDATGSYVISDPGNVKPVTFLGDSWFSNGGAAYATAVQTRFPQAQVINAGISGNNSQNLIDRFATDVPVNSAYVIINEPGVNDVYSELPPSTQAAHLDTLLALIRGIGAVPIIVGIPPLFDYPGLAARAGEAIGAAIQPSVESVETVSLAGVLAALQYSPAANSTAFGKGAQQKGTGGNSTAFGYYAQGVGAMTGGSNTAFGALAQNAITTGISNTAVGDSAQLPLTTGTANTAVGQTAQRQITTGGFNTAVGQGAQNALTTANSNVAVGAAAQLALTTGTGNVAVGQGAQYNPAGVAGNATTTASYQVAIGYQSGQAGATQTSYGVAIGCQALYGAQGAMALGAFTSATGLGSVAIGRDSGGTGASTSTQDEIALGTALHKVKISNNATGAGSAALGANCPAVTPGAPYTWLRLTSSDGSTVYAPVWK